VKESGKGLFIVNNLVILKLIFIFSCFISQLTFCIMGWLVNKLRELTFLVFIIINVIYYTRSFMIYLCLSFKTAL